METDKEFPYEFQNLAAKDLEEIRKCFNGTVNEFVRVGPKGCLVPKGYNIKFASSIYNMPLRPKDVFVSTYPRSGTTMMQELVWLLVNDFDYETAKSTLLVQRCTFLEHPIFLDDKSIDILIAKHDGNVETAKEQFKKFEDSPMEILRKTPDPRVIKSHFPLSLLPPKLLDTARVVYVARDPRDVAVSAYHHSKLFVQIGLRGDFKQFWNLFRNGLYWYIPYFEHVKEAWAQRKHPNMLFLFYDDLRKDLPTNLRRIAKFFGKEPTEKQISDLCDHLNIDNFKNNKSVNFEEMRTMGLLAENEQFIRKGKSGGWREYFDEDMTNQAEAWIIDNLRNTDLRFPSMQDIEI